MPYCACLVLKAHHSPTQSLHCCGARSGGAGVIAKAFQHFALLQPGPCWPALWLAVIIPVWWGRNEKEMEAENCRNRLNQSRFTVDLSDKCSFTQPESTSTSVRSHKVPQTLVCNGKITWAQFSCCFTFDRDIYIKSEPRAAAVDSRCCHIFSLWVVQRRVHQINHAVHSLCAPLTGSDLDFLAAIKYLSCAHVWK